jgi:predicted kinase
MQYSLCDIGEIVAGLDLEPGMERHLILISALPGAGKTTLAREFARQTGGAHFEIDEVKRVVVPSDMVADEIDPPEYRYKYYAETIRKLPDLFAKSPANIVIIDETFHLHAFREMWRETAKELNIQVHWIEVVCDDEVVKERLGVGKGRKDHILGDKAFPMYLLFKEVFEPFKGPREVVDNTKDLAPQVKRILEKYGIQGQEMAL